MASVFTKIIHGELPGYKVHEDELTISILALDQINLGHTLVIPKQEINHWFDVPEAALFQIHKNAQKIGKAMVKATGCKRVLQATIGFEVPHVHLHLIPAWSMADLDFSKARRYSEEDMKKILTELKQAFT